MTIGIDPGTATVGFSLVSGTRNHPIIHEYGILQTLPLPKEQMPFRLLELGRDLESIILKYKPNNAVVEDLFFFKNAKTVISVAQSRGMTLYLLAKHNVKILELTPLQIKQSLCGYGRATKVQVQNMVKKIYKLDQIPKPDDAADSLAMAWLGLK
ncbi:MAG: crossover junction endodeoxyribonuclease RuvC [candidate division SR1 bacterium]|nr:crossover junction endodeoxyribonuclease RuvC [candidate division SR1 bacterium]